MCLIKNIFLLFLFSFFCFFFHNCAPLVAEGGFVKGGITVSSAASEDDTDDDDGGGEGDGGDGEGDGDGDGDGDDDDDDDNAEEPVGEEFDGSETEEGGRAPITRSLH